MTAAASPGASRLRSVASPAALATTLTTALGPTATTGGFRRRVGGFEFLFRIFDFEFLADQAFDRVQLAAFIPGAERNRHAVGARSSGPTDPVNVALRFDRHVEIDHVADAIDVDSASGNVGRDKHADLVISKRVQCFLTRVLSFVTVNRDRLDAALVKFFHQRVGAVFGTCEHDRTRHVAAQQQFGQRGNLVVTSHDSQPLLDQVDAGFLRRDVDRDRVEQQAAGQFPDVRRERCGEEHRLTLFRQRRNDFLQCGQETHVEHPVGFVEHEHLDVFKLDVALVHQVDQTTRCRDQHIDALTHRIDLAALIHAAVDESGAELHVFSVLVKTIVDLNGEFAGRREHQSGGPVRGGTRFFMAEEIKDGQRKRGGFSSSGLSTTEHVLAGDAWRDGLRLNRSWGRVLEFDEGTLEWFVQIDGFEILQGGSLQILRNTRRTDTVTLSMGGAPHGGASQPIGIVERHVPARLE